MQKQLSDAVLCDTGTLRASADVNALYTLQDQGNRSWTGFDSANFYKSSVFEDHSLNSSLERQRDLMSDAAVSDTAGPSTVTDPEIGQGLEDAERNFQQGIQALQVRPQS